jgi:hypothetical protein
MDKIPGDAGSFKVKDLEGRTCIYIRLRGYKDPATINEHDPYGNTPYYEWTFMASGAKAETDGNTRKGIAKLIVQAELFKGGALNAEAERNFVLIEGMPHTQRQQQLGHPVIILER